MNPRTCLLLVVLVAAVVPSCKKKSEPAVDAGAAPVKVVPSPPPATDAAPEPADEAPAPVAAPAWRTPLALADAKHGAVVVWLGAQDTPAAVWQPVDANGLPNGEAKPLAAVPSDARVLRAVQAGTSYAVGWCRVAENAASYGLLWVGADGVPLGDPVDLGSETPFEEGAFGGNFPACDLDLSWSSDGGVLYVRQSGETECAEETGTDEPGAAVACPGQKLLRVTRGAEPQALKTQGLLAPVGGPRSPIAVGEDAFWAATLQTATLRTLLAGTTPEGPCPGGKLDAIWGSHAVLFWTAGTLVVLGDSMAEEGLHLAACRGGAQVFPPNEEAPLPVWPRVALRTLECDGRPPKATFALGDGRTLDLYTVASDLSGSWRHLLRALDGRDDPYDAAFTGAFDEDSFTSASFVLAHVGEGEEGAVRLPVTLEARACGPEGVKL
jgi:hypothetical protein